MLPPAARPMLLVCLLAGCTGGEGTDDARARRARQMRDVSRMLDAMERPDQARDAPAIPAAVPRPVTTEAIPSPPGPEGPRWPTLAGIALGLLAVAAPLAWRRRRRRPPCPMPEDTAPSPLPSVLPPTGAGDHADAPVAVTVAVAENAPDARARPTWIYRTSPYETPVLHMVPAPVDLLPPHRPEPTPVAALALAREAMQRARQLSGSDADEACSVALMHAFLAEQDPSLRAEATACRQAVTALYEALPHRGH
jgi:MYXO-CTERM domain-containing protein